MGIVERPRSRAWRLGAALVVVAAVVLRTAPIVRHRLAAERITTVDSARYLELADRLTAGDGFRSRAAGGELEPELFRTPGYPAVLALAGRLPGARGAWVLGLQILAATASVALCFVLVRAWASPPAGVAAAALLALDPAHVVYSNLLMADVLCGAAIAAGLVLIEHVRGSPAAGQPTGEGWRLAAAGCLLTTATALRPVAVLLVVPAAIYLGRRARSRVAVAVFVAAALLFPLSWTARNGLTTGSWTLSTAFDVNLALVAASRVEARAANLSRSDGEARVMARVAALQRASGLPFHRACRAVARDAILQAPAAARVEASQSFVEMLLAGERRYLFQILVLPAGAGQQRRAGWLDFAAYPRRERLAVFAQAAFMAAVWLLAAGGALSLWRRQRGDVALFTLAALAVVLAPSLVVGTGRMRLPVAILIHGLAGIGAAAVAAGISRDGHRF